MNFAFNAYSASQYSLLQNVATVCTKSSLLCTCTGPCFAAYATNVSVSASLVVSQIVILLLVPLLSLSVSCILGWLIAFVTSRTRHKML